MIGIARKNDGSGWVTLFLEENIGELRIAGSSPASLQTVVPDALATQRGDFSFTTRPVSDVLERGYAREPADLEKYPGIAITVFLPQSAEDPSLWTVVYRHPGVGFLSWAGAESRFRVQDLRRKIDGHPKVVGFENRRPESYFEREDWRSFEPPHPIELSNPMARVSRPAFDRELLVRSGWTAKALLPEVFRGSPSLLQTPDSNVDFATRKRLDEKSRLEARRAADLAWRTASPEERAALELARKKAVGLTAAVVKVDPPPPRAVESSADGLVFRPGQGWFLNPDASGPPTVEPEQRPEPHPLVRNIREKRQPRSSRSS